MKTIATMAAAMALWVAAVTNVSAVDIVNEDDVTHIVTIYTNGKETKLEIGLGETLFDACEFCLVVISGDDGIKAERDAIITIHEEKLATDS